MKYLIMPYYRFCSLVSSAIIFLIFNLVGILWNFNLELVMPVSEILDVTPAMAYENRWYYRTVWDYLLGRNLIKE